MRIAGFGCLGCGGLLALGGAAAVVAALIPGIVNSAEKGTAMMSGGGLCGAAFLPILVGAVLVAVGGRKQ